MIAFSAVGGVIRASDRGLDHPSQIVQGGALTSVGLAAPLGPGHIGQDDGEHLLVTIGTSSLGIGHLNHRPGVSETGLVVDVVV